MSKPLARHPHFSDDSDNLPEDRYAVKNKFLFFTVFFQTLVSGWISLVGPSKIREKEMAPQDHDCFRPEIACMQF
ncbi:hypothetical protein [Neomesorhizobium albiziae]|uniref:hypothetical protein n=1 Tax=Neomesorhizobium albiziae TaxID=335020 RepID=UPI00122C59D3|nr:hypothetical protein [Mesorhizobium albiziae]